MNKKGREKTKLINGMHRGFQKGYNQVPIGKQEELRMKLRILIGGATRCKMLYWKTGKTIIKADMAKKIERVFRGYGITDIWDE